MILGISGRAGSGKDTVADHLIKMGIMDRKESFARKLKEYCGEMFDIPHDDLYNGKDRLTEVEVTNSVIELIPELKNRRGSFLVVREVLQYFGTNLMRGFYNTIWVDLATRDVGKDENVVIPDVRFTNEALAIKRRGGMVIRLTRNPTDMDHASETALDDYTDFDLIYDNEGETAEETCTAIAELIKGTRYE